jgi:hypothetical protein
MIYSCNVKQRFASLAANVLAGENKPRRNRNCQDRDNDQIGKVKTPGEQGLMQPQTSNDYYTQAKTNRLPNVHYTAPFHYFVRLLRSRRHMVLVLN